MFISGAISCRAGSSANLPRAARALGPMRKVAKKAGSVVLCVCVSA